MPSRHSGSVAILRSVSVSGSNTDCSITVAGLLLRRQLAGPPLPSGTPCRLRLVSTPAADVHHVLPPWLSPWLSAEPQNLAGRGGT
jgi:hypothetical protein